MVKAFRKLDSLYFFLGVLLLITSCISLQSGQTSEFFYTNPVVTYLREAPESNSQIVATVHRGDQVTILSRAKDDWCRVKVAQGEQIGWIQGVLLSSIPIQVETYYVQTDNIPLRDSPQKEKISRHLLHRGDRVRKLDQNNLGWWWVLVEQDKSLGWIPASAVTVHPPVKSPPGDEVKSAKERGAGPDSSLRSAPQPAFFVATNSLELHLLPLISSQVVKVLQFNQKVEKVSQSGSDWLKVRHPETGIQGWTLASYLNTSPAQAPKSLTPRRKKAPEKPSDPQPKKTPVVQPEEVDPEVM